MGTLAEIEAFHLYLMSDLYREEKPINFSAANQEGREIDKKYFIVPIKMQWHGDSLRAGIDR